MAHQAVRAIIIKDNQLLVMERNKFGHRYFTLIGGGINIGEDAETALRRELHEESGLSVGQIRHIFTEDAGDPFGRQYIFLCEYQGGEPVMRPDSDEAKINELGQNMYLPRWLPLADLKRVEFLSESLRQALLNGISHGWPNSPVVLDWKEAVPIEPATTES
ncbi:MAG: NUDIX domain-containing protein [Candidatus Saccharimonadales bacterium]